MKFNLTKEDILNKQFIPSYKGYDPNDVDEFLDLVLKDYSSLEEAFKKTDEMIESLKKENNELKNSLRELKRDQELMGSRLSSNSKNDLNTQNYQSTSLDNLELLKKCANYEKKLYSLGYDPSKIK